jgi:hypothetical protein
VITFEQTIQECVNNKQFMDNYRRLYKSDVGLPQSPINKMIDEATDFKQAQWNDLFKFIFRYVWLPVLAQSVQEASN